MENKNLDLQLETIDFLIEELSSIIKHQVKEKVKLFEQFLTIPKENKDFGDLDSDLVYALNDYTSARLSPKDFLSKISRTEPYLGSLVYIVDKNVYTKIKTGSHSFADIIKYIGLMQVKSNGDLDYSISSRKDQGQLSWSKTYIHRNAFAHSNPKYSTTETNDLIISLLYVKVESIWKYKNEIEKIYLKQLISKESQRGDYYNQIKSSYESNNLQNSFVFMKSLKIDPLKQFFSTEYNNDRRDVDESNIEIIDIFSNGNYIKLMGEAGLGKSRIMRHLQYTEVLKRQTYPVYVELKELSDNNYSILNLISEKAKIDIDKCELLMKAGGMTLYLDGINEILSSDKIRKSICNDIDALAIEYPKTRIMVSDRDNSQFSVKNSIPTFLLSRLDESMTNEFIRKNSSPECGSKMIVELNDKKFLYKIVNTPFLLLLFISLFEQSNYIPSITNKSQLIEIFIKNLIYREFTEKKEIRAQKIELLLTYLFLNEQYSDETELSFLGPKILVEFRKCKEYYGFEINTDEILEIIVQMGLLEKISNDRYKFQNKLYEEYFYNKSYLWH